MEGRELLQQLGALSETGQLSDHGRRIAQVGLHPRLAQLLLKAQDLGAAELGCALAALLSERDPLDPREAGCDLMRRLDWLQAGGRDPRRQAIQQLQAQLLRQIRSDNKTPNSASPDTAALAAELIAQAYPERVSQQRDGSPGRFLMRGGRGAELHPSDPLQGCEALAVARADGAGSNCRIQLALPLSRGALLQMADAGGQEQSLVNWDAQAQRVRCERALQLGALVLERRPWPDAPVEALREAMVEGLQQLGLEALPWNPESRQLQRRLNLAHAELGAPWPDREDAVLLADPLSWLGDQLTGLRSREDLQGLNLSEALWSGLEWSRRAELDSLLPISLSIPSGRQASLDYSSGTPVLAVKLQELFGAKQTPRVLGGRLAVTVHLLSPAGRPAAITQDLEGFWASTYREVRRELRGRYPKHPWPDDPSEAVPTALTKRRLQQDQSQR